ncbi:MAG TPA: hypothetical protein VHA33_21520 [Candidatus Angelobacter sp.]|jgi:hypothetical protein|nr:hypothetical protein [Candidatus Angelobacter sp.]
MLYSLIGNKKNDAPFEMLDENINRRPTRLAAEADVTVSVQDQILTPVQDAL